MVMVCDRCGETFEYPEFSMRNMAAYEISKNAVDMLESASLRIENAIAFLEDAES